MEERKGWCRQGGRHPSFAEPLVLPSEGVSDGPKAGLLTLERRGRNRLPKDRRHRLVLSGIYVRRISITVAGAVPELPGRDARMREMRDRTHVRFTGFPFHPAPANGRKRAPFGLGP